MTPGWGETPRIDRSANEADTPATGGGAKQAMAAAETPGASKRRSRWDLTPAQTPLVGAPGGATPSGFTPAGGGGLNTPSGGAGLGFTPTGATPNALMTPTGEHQLESCKFSQFYHV